MSASSSLLRKALIETGFLRHAQMVAAWRRRSPQLDALRQMRGQLGGRLRALRVPAATGTALLFGLDTVSGAALHSVMVTGSRLAGYEPVILLPARSALLEAAYGELGIKRFVFLEDYGHPGAAGEARVLLAAATTSEQLLQAESHGCRVGRAALSSLMRRIRKGRIPLRDPAVRAMAQVELTDSIAAAAIAARILADVQPQVVVFVDRGYTPTAQFFDLALTAGIPVFTWNAGHRDNILLLKRYGTANRDDHPMSLSSESWARLSTMPWEQDGWEKVLGELEFCYRSGQWFSEVGTQFNKSLMDATAVRARLGIAADRKVAAIFPHIFWDATFFWGTDLFPNYEEWFVETVRAAAANPHMDWLIKVHPANVTKDRRDNYHGEHSELTALREALPELPPNIRLLPADTDISTFSLFALMDYCVTVRGTVGIEAACFGIPTVTAGTGRFDRLGFTLDCDSAAEYLALLGRLHTVPGLSPEQIELARKFSHGVFLGRPLRLDSIAMGYVNDGAATLSVAFADTLPGTDVAELATWMRSGREDYLDERALP